VYASSDSERAVIVRVSFDGATRQVRLGPNGEGQVIAADHAPSLATVTILDAQTCEELAVQPLPIGRIIVGFRDFSGGLAVSIDPKNVGRTDFSMPEELVTCPP
jgi:hypothetical protein